MIQYVFYVKKYGFNIIPIFNGCGNNTIFLNKDLEPSTKVFIIKVI